MYTEIQKLKAVDVLQTLWVKSEEDYFFGQQDTNKDLHEMLIAAKTAPSLYTRAMWWAGISRKLREAGVNITEPDMGRFYHRSAQPLDEYEGDFEEEATEGSFEFLTDVYDTIIAQATLQDVNLGDFL